MLLDGMIAFLSAVGLTALVWLAAGVVGRGGRRGIPGLVLVLPLEGDAPAMEADVRQLRRVQGSLPGAKLVLEDCGLSPEGRMMAEYFVMREKNAVMMNKDELGI